MPTKVITGVTSTGSIGALSADTQESINSVSITGSIGTLTINIVNGPVSGARTALIRAQLRKIYIDRKPTSADRVVYANED
jgi:hypothetical protein|tara:strand:+ start:208 stop:450 length:243 start_codon:yes stop_codon:yes gene_type:complete